MTLSFLKGYYWQPVILGWLLFDFANSIVAINGAVYFTKWLVENFDDGVIYLNSLFFMTAIIIFFSGPYLGHLVDTQGALPWMKRSVVGAGTASLCVSVVAMLATPSAFVIAVAVVGFLSFLVSYTIGRIAHNAFLRVHIPQDIRESFSGVGAASNWLGSVAGLLITLPIVIVVEPPRSGLAAFATAALVFFALAWLASHLMRSNGKRHLHTPKAGELELNLDHRSTTVRGWLPTISIVLLGYFFIFDALWTVQRNLPGFLVSVYSMDDQAQAMGFLLILTAAALGGIVAARFVSFRNAAATIFIFCITLGCAMIALVFFMQIVYLSFFVAGFCYGVLESAIRLDFMKTIEEREAGRKFGLLAAVERVAGVFGPAVWVLPFFILPGEQKAYLAAMLIMALAVVAGGIVVAWTRYCRKNRV